MPLAPLITDHHNPSYYTNFRSPHFQPLTLIFQLIPCSTPIPIVIQPPEELHGSPNHFTVYYRLIFHLWCWILWDIAVCTSCTILEFSLLSVSLSMHF